MFGLDTKRCSTIGTDLQPAPPQKTARNKTNPKSILPKRISQLQQIVHPLSTLELLQNMENVGSASERFGDFCEHMTRFCLFGKINGGGECLLLPFLGRCLSISQPLAGRERLI